MLRHALEWGKEMAEWLLLIVAVWLLGIPVMAVVQGVVAQCHPRAKVPATLPLTPVLLWPVFALLLVVVVVPQSVGEYAAIVVMRKRGKE